MLQKAIEFCGEVKALGTALLSALEKKDAEALSLLRSAHEIQLLEAVRQIKDLQIKEANQSKESLDKSKDVTQARYDYYSKLIKEGQSKNEKLHLEKLEWANTYQLIGQASDVAASIAHLFPTFTIGLSGVSGSPVSTVGIGGPNFGTALQATAGVFRGLATHNSYEGTRASS